jgi:hypothetical protein
MFVWGSIQQRGMYSRTHLPTFHCKDHDVRQRAENWREYPFKMAFEVGEHVLPCKTCFPALAERWLDLLRRSTG